MSKRDPYGFREKMLHHFTQQEDDAALRHVAKLLHEMALEFARHCRSRKAQDLTDAKLLRTHTSTNAGALRLPEVLGRLLHLGADAVKPPSKS